MLRSNDRELEGELDADLKLNASQNPSIYNMKYKGNMKWKEKTVKINYIICNTWNKLRPKNSTQAGNGQDTVGRFSQLWQLGECKIQSIPHFTSD